MHLDTITFSLPLLATATETADSSLVLAAVLLSIVVIYLASKVGGEALEDWARSKHGRIMCWTIRVRRLPRMAATLSNMDPNWWSWLVIIVRLVGIIRHHNNILRRESTA